eukprot:2487568-Ditylum_brightwellii.AAC.1
MNLRFQQAVRAQIQQTQKDMDSPNSFVQFLPPKILAQSVQYAEEELLKGNPEHNKPWCVMGCHYFLPLCKARNHAQAKTFANRTEENKHRL